MAVGMATVFAILILIIYLGKGLITLVNKYVPEEIIVKKRTPVLQAQPVDAAKNMTGSTTAVIVSAISIATGGKGHVTRIEKQ